MSDIPPRHAEPASRQAPAIIRLPMRNWVADNPEGISFVPRGPVLPADKEARELFVVETFARTTLRGAGREWQGLRSFSPDPPDVVGEEGGVPFGLEVTELRNADRASGDAQRLKLRHDVEEALAGDRPALKGLVFRLAFLDPLALRQEIPKRKKRKGLVKAVADAIRRCAETRETITLPPPFRHVTMEGHVAEGDQRLTHPDDPLVLFTADTQAVWPDVERAVAEATVRKKLAVDPGADKYHLLIWTRAAEHHQIYDALHQRLSQVLAAHLEELVYDEVFLFALRPLDRERGSGWDIAREKAMRRRAETAADDPE